MTQPPEQQPQPQQWWQPQDPQAATGPHSGQWQQAPDGPHQTGSYTGQWQQNPGAQPQTGPYGGPWQQQQQQPNPPVQQQGQFGGGFQPTQYGGLGAFEEVLVTKKERSKKPLIFIGAGVVVLAAAGVTAWLLGAFAGDTLDQKSLQDGVSKVLTDNYGEHDIKNASCPSGQAAKNGTTFDCTVDVSGQPKTVTVRVLNEKPEYEVGAPH